MAFYTFDTEKLTITCDGELIGTDEGFAAVVALTRIIADRAANAELEMFERVLGQAEVQRVVEADIRASHAPTSAE